MTHKLSWILTPVALSLTGCRTPGPTPPEVFAVRPGDRMGRGAPMLAQAERTRLAELVRRSLAERRLVRDADVSRLVSGGWGEQRCRAHVTVWNGSEIVGHGAGGYAPIPVSFAAALNALVREMSRGATRRHAVERVAVECELTGPADAVPLEGAGGMAWEAYFEPGIHGVGLHSSSGWREIRPSEVIRSDWGARADATLPMVAELINGDASARPAAIDAPRACRFRSTHFWQRQAGEEAILLERGLVRVESENVNARSLDWIIRSLGDYLIRRQVPEGLFRYSYNARTGEVTATGNWVRQAGATWTLGVYATMSGRTDAREASDRALRAWAHSIVPLETPPGSACVDTPNGKRKLGTTALVLLALLESPDAGRWITRRDQLIEGILSLQTEDGSFLTHFPPAEPTGSQYYYPGEALLALSCAYEITRDDRIARAFENAHRYYQDLFERDPVPAFVPWQTQAHVGMYRLTGRRDYADFALRMNDWLVGKQIDCDDTPWPDLVGGIPNHPSRPPGISTASYLEGLTDALALARTLGDGDRAARYESVVRSAARFVIQLVVRPEETYFHVRPEESVWGMRTFLTDHRLRIDHVQHALAALMKTRRVLFGDASNHAEKPAHSEAAGPALHRSAAAR